MALGLLGAEGSGTISHLGAPPSCVIATVQSGGMAPGFTESNVMLCGEAEQARIKGKAKRII
jgi:hypothetical protein